jgi:D-alanyl-lipoteichoic acid acyltransferase DltB (MBOAT superfamily)
VNFASIEYLVFLVLIWATYCVLARPWQNLLLLAASYYFYAQWDWRFLSLIAISTVIDYVAGRVLGRSERDAVRRAALTVSVVANLGLLAFFKYFNFFVDSFVHLLQSWGFPSHRLTLEIVLPVGISFYTFQTMSYTIDVYRRKLAATRDFLTFALFVSYFPQLVAGPIERATHLLPVLQRPRKVTLSNLRQGCFLILLGLVKKLTIADGLSGLVDSIYGTSAELSGADVLLATYAFAFQILGDFSAYTDIARGSSKLFGIELMDNFNAPYFAKGPADFWRRWHISLSTWLRDYLYIPIGGNRYGPLRTYRNLLITMILGGLWHGAAWNFVLWGLYQGLLLCGFRWIGGGRPESQLKVSPVGLFVELMRRFAFFQLVCFGWLLFRAHSFDQIVALCHDLVTIGGWTHLSMSKPPLGTLCGLCFLLPWEAMTYVKGTDAFHLNWSAFTRGALVGLLVILLAMGLNNNASSFIYFQF